MLTGRGWRRVGCPKDLPGIGGFHELVAGHVEEPSQVVIGIETDRGLWVGALSAAGYRVYAINPLAVAHYRDRHHVSGAKSDAGDAKLLADLVRTDRHNHRPIAGDRTEAEAIKVLARAHQNLIWTRTRHTNALRSALREYYPGALAAFEDLADRDALAVLGRAPTPEQGAGLGLAAIRSALKKAGRQRYIDARARDIQAALRTEQLATSDVVSAKPSCGHLCFQASAWFGAVRQLRCAHGVSAYPGSPCSSGGRAAGPVMRGTAFGVGMAVGALVSVRVAAVDMVEFATALPLGAP